MRRKSGGLVPLEARILEAGLVLRDRGAPEFHGYELRGQLRAHRGFEISVERRTRDCARERVDHRKWLARSFCRLNQTVADSVTLVSSTRFDKYSGERRKQLGDHGCVTPQHLVREKDAASRMYSWRPAQGHKRCPRECSRVSAFSRRVQRTLRKLPGVSANALSLDRDGQLWVGTLEGLVQVNSASGFAMKRIAEVPGTTVQTLALGPRGSLWAGTPEGLLEIDSRNGRILRSVTQLRGRNVKAIAFDRVGSIWVGTDAGPWMEAVRGTVCEAGVTVFMVSRGIGLRSGS